MPHGNYSPVSGLHVQQNDSLAMMQMNSSDVDGWEYWLPIWSMWNVYFLSAEKLFKTINGGYEYSFPGGLGFVCEFTTSEINEYFSILYVAVGPCGTFDNRT